MSDPDATTRLLQRLVAGESSVSDELLATIYTELRKLAAGHLASESPRHTLQPTALVHEAYVKLVQAPGDDVESRGHFFALASKVMRSLLVDHARRKKAQKRGGGQVLMTLEGTDSPSDAGPLADAGAGSGPATDVLDVHDALEQLTAVDAQLAQIVELRWFGGLTVAETAEATGLTRRQVERRWLSASAWLHDRLDG